MIANTLTLCLSASIPLKTKQYEAHKRHVKNHFFVRIFDPLIRLRTTSVRPCYFPNTKTREFRQGHTFFGDGT
ncbi:MAG TPA: hypothetical protein DIW64_22055 [Cellvibrio sp.]|nr:hypothetical protein [Cellvibrio sp.]